MSNDKDDAMVGALAALAATGVSCMVSLNFHFTPPEPNPLEPTPGMSGSAASDLRPGRIRLDWSAGDLDVAAAILTQSIISGQLGSDEARSLIENSPAIAHSLLRGLAQMDDFSCSHRMLGFSDLRILADQGALTAKVLIAALIWALKTVDDEPKVSLNAGFGEPFVGQTACLLSPAADETLVCLFLRGPTADGDLPSKAGRTELVRIGLVDRGQGWNWLTSDGIGEAIRRGLHVRKDTLDRERAAPAAEPARAEYKVPTIKLYLFADEGLCVGGARRAIFGATTEPEVLYEQEGRWFLGIREVPLPSGWPAD